jgi:hypothetical protein
MLKSLLVKNFKNDTEFTMTQVRAVAQKDMEEAYPDNNTMSFTIARNLQGLRNDGVIFFVEGRRGTYRWCEKQMPSEPPPSSESDDDMEAWSSEEEDGDGDEEKLLAEPSFLSKDMMWNMCRAQYKMIETLREANASLTEEVEELKEKDRKRQEMVAKARQVVREALGTSSPSFSSSSSSSSSDDEVDHLASTWSNEAVDNQYYCVKFDEVVEEKVYEIDRTMRPHKRWKKEPVVKMSSNMGVW